MASFVELPSEAKALFPSHGWLEGNTGLRHLRLPLLQVFQPGHLAYAKYHARGLAGVWLQTRSPVRTLRQLAVALRELHFELRQLTGIANEEWLDREVSDARNLALNRQREGSERCEVLLVSIFILLRRLADDIVNALRPALFEHWNSAPGKLSSAVDLAQRGGIHSLKPFCDADELSKQLISNSAWLQRLRKEDGIRDTLVHRPHFLSVNQGGSKPFESEKIEWHISADLMILTNNGIRSKNILPVLVECIAGACELMTAISRLVGGMESYSRGDVLFLTGADNDVVGFWPAIRGGRYEFPLLK